MLTGSGPRPTWSGPKRYHKTGRAQPSLHPPNLTRFIWHLSSTFSYPSYLLTGSFQILIRDSQDNQIVAQRQGSMAKADEGPWTNMQTQTLSNEPNEAGMPSGWKYRSLRVGPFKLPCYASPESQLILVSFVCFLCPGKALSSSSGIRQVQVYGSLMRYRHVQCCQRHRSSRPGRRCQSQ